MPSRLSVRPQVNGFRFVAMPYNLLVKRTCASYAGWSAYRERYVSVTMR